MQLLEVYTPGIEIYVKYKVLDPRDVEAFVRQNANSTPEAYASNVLEMCVFNLKSEVRTALKKLDRDDAHVVLDSIYNGCRMLNPGFDVDTWLRLADKQPEQQEVPQPRRKERSSGGGETKTGTSTKRTRSRKITKPRFLGLEPYLKSRLIGQDDAIEEVVNALKRQVAGLGDENRPMGIFLFAGASGVGKTHLAKELHNYLFGEEHDMVRIDCGEYQHKHENQKLLGSPPGYLGHENGGFLTNQMSEKQNTVLLLDEVEKAHPDIWDTFLRVFDEGELTDGTGKQVSFRNSIIIMTTNLGNTDVIESMSEGLGFTHSIGDLLVAPKRHLVEKYTVKAIRKSFRPEFLNRMDKTVVFNHLTNKDLIEIARLECDAIEAKLTKKGMKLSYPETVLEAMVREGVNPIEGARGLSKVRRDQIENAISDKLLSTTRWPRGTVIYLGWTEEEGYTVDAKKPKRNTA